MDWILEHIKRNLLIYSVIAVPVFLAFPHYWNLIRNRSKPILEAKVEIAPFNYPKGLVEILYGLRSNENIKQIDIDDILKDIDIKDSYKRLIKNQLYGAIAKYLTDQLSWQSGMPEPYRDIHTYWNIKITNKGTQLAKNVKFILPGLIYACIEQEGIKEAHCFNTLGPIDIGELHPSEELIISAWSSSLHYIYPETNKVRLTYEMGTGKIRLRGYTDPFWYKLSIYVETIKQVPWKGLIIYYIIVSCIILILRKCGTQK